MADEIQQLINMVANLRSTMLEKFAEVDRKFDKIDVRFTEVDNKLKEHDRCFNILENKIDKLNQNQIKIINTINVFKHDIENNRKHIEKLENKDDYLKIGE